MISLSTLKSLKNDSIVLNKKLKEILEMTEEHNLNLDGIRDISLRIRKAFELYKSLVDEL